MANDDLALGAVAPGVWLPAAALECAPTAVHAWAGTVVSATRVLGDRLAAWVHEQAAAVVCGSGSSLVPGDADTDQRAVLALAEQMAIDVAGAPMLVGPVAAQTAPERLRELVSALWVLEYNVRLRAMMSVLVSTSLIEMVSGAPQAHTLREQLGQYQNAVVLHDTLDIVTTELVRLRCGRSHHCRICQTLRLDAARRAGVDDAMTDKIDRYELSDLADRHKVALRITDALITRPDTLPTAAVVEARQHFDVPTLIELCLDISKWSTQKIVVALEADGTERLPLNDRGTTMFAFGDDGAVSGYWA